MDLADPFDVSTEDLKIVVDQRPDELRLRVTATCPKGSLPAPLFIATVCYDYGDFP